VPLILIEHDLINGSLSLALTQVHKLGFTGKTN